MTKTNVDLTATEQGYLWHTYQALSMNECFLKYFDSIVEDEEVKQLNQSSLESCQSYLEEISSIFIKEGFPIPVGFSEDDVNLTADKLYTDPFILFFQWFLGKGDLTFGSLAINTIAREDVFNFFDKYTSEGLSTLNRARKILLSKGLWIRAPYIPLPEGVRVVEKESFLNGWLGELRPLSGIEIASTFYNIITNTIGAALLTSFIQVTKTDEIKNYLKTGKEISEKHIELLTKTLTEEDLLVSSTWNSGITASTESPFSERLMLSMVSFLNGQGMSNYGAAISTSYRRDIAANFSRLAAEVAKYGGDGMNLIINYGWMEEPPHAPKKE